MAKVKRQYSKAQVSMLIALGAMIIGHVGIVLYKGPHRSASLAQQLGAQQSASSQMTFMPGHGGSAKSFGFATHQTGGAQAQEQQFQVASVRELDRVFSAWDYTLERAKKEGTVPRLYLAKLPRGGIQHRTRSSKNPTFVQVLLPHILKVNEQILNTRTRLLEMQKRVKAGGHLRHPEKTWLTQLAAEYRCKSTKIDALLLHVDIVPPSLALAQATLETGGGSSHAVRNKNSPFGHMATKTKVAKFESLFHSVRAYVLNLNRHNAYSGFRKTRAELRKKKQQVSGVQLAACLTKYSVRGSAYTRDLQNLIRRRSLESFDRITLDPPLGAPIRLKP